MLLSEVAATSAAVAVTAARTAKIALIADLLARVPASEARVAVAFLSGELVQGQIGVGYAMLASVAADAAAGPGAALTEVSEAFGAIAAVTGPGSQGERRRLLAGLLAQASAAEQEFTVRLLSGDLRQGALEGVMTEAVAAAAGVPARDVRRAHQLRGSLPEVAAAALSAGSAQAAAAALRDIRLRVGRPVRPMLAASAPDVTAALARISPAAAEWKIDGIRIQVHRSGSVVTVFTRALEEITARVPEIARAAAALRGGDVVLDGEAVALAPDGRPRPFQVTAARIASLPGTARQRAATPLTAFFFDLLHLDGTDLFDVPAAERHALLAGIVPGQLIPRIVTADPAEADRFLADAVSRGHEGVVLKSLHAPYQAGRRGSEWIKVKPRHTLDLVILAAEWGHGRRRGLLSNLHLGARDSGTGDYVMLGKTFKGLTDEMLSWQTARLLELAEPARRQPAGEGGASGSGRAGGGVVLVRPELVAEIAFDGVQSSSRYPGGVALRFARVVRFRPDKSPAEADTIAAVRAIWEHGSAGMSTLRE